MANSFWPGQSFRPRTDFRTGEGEVFRQLGNLAATGGDIAVKLYVQQAQDQFSTAQIQTKQAEADYAASLSKELDESKYPGMLKKYESSIKEFRPKNPLAAHDFDGYIANKSIEWGKANTKAMEDRLLDKWEVKADILEKEFIETGDEIAFVEHMGRGVQLHGQDESQSLARVEKTRHSAERRKAENAALSKPEGFLEKVKGNKIEGFPLLTPGDVQDMRNVALGEISFRKRQEDQVSSDLIDDVTSHAVQGTTPDQMKELIRQTVGITDKEKTLLMKSYMSAQSIWEDKGVDPYMTTQSFPDMVSVQFAIEDDKVNTLREIDQAWLSGPNGTPRWSFQHNQWLKNLWKANQSSADSSYSLSHPLAKEYFNGLANFYLNDEGDFEGDVADYHGRRLDLEANLEANWDNPAEAAKRFDEITEPLRKKKANGTLSKIWGFVTTSPLSTAIKLTNFQLLLSKARGDRGE